MAGACRGSHRRIPERKDGLEDGEGNAKEGTDGKEEPQVMVDEAVESYPEPMPLEEGGDEDLERVGGDLTRALDVRLHPLDEPHDVLVAQSGDEDALPPQLPHVLLGADL